ncbi:hypothetical protein HBI82_104590 [Parastagonospora nodorum]|nr:hypothetical protein HBI82_104590 [Parastagonospora nodorum]
MLQRPPPRDTDASAKPPDPRQCSLFGSTSISGHTSPILRSKTQAFLRNTPINSPWLLCFGRPISTTLRSMKDTPSCNPPMLLTASYPWRWAGSLLWAD